MKTDHLYHHKNKFELESGGYLPGFQLKYTTFGKLNSDMSNVIWVCHALTGSSDPVQWWDGLFENGDAFDAEHHFIVCANALGGCYGSTGPLSINPETGKTYYHTFPKITNRDIVRAFDQLRLHLGFSVIHTLIGGSLGGQQVLEWAILQPAVFDHIIPIACNAWHSPWGIAFNEAQRMAIEVDPTWKEDSARAGVDGMKTARAIAMISYRSYEIFNLNQGEESDTSLEGFRASTYQRYQGQKLANRFNAFTYQCFTKAMDSHHIGRGRISVEGVLAGIKAKTLIVGIDQDILFPITEQKFLTKHIPGAKYSEISSPFGHDGFLVEFDQLNHLIKEFYKEKIVKPSPNKMVML